MKRWIDRLLLIVVAVLVAALVVSSIPWFNGEPMSGRWLLLHMFASGALVTSLPLLAISCLWRNLRSRASGFTERLGYWWLVVAGLTTIGTVFLCMLPLPTTTQMHELMWAHSYAGFAMVPAVLLLAIGSARWRRIEARRSATLG